MTLAAAFTAVGSALGLLGLVVLLVATVLSSVADLTGRDLGSATADEVRS